MFRPRCWLWSKLEHFPVSLLEVRAFGGNVRKTGDVYQTNALKLHNELLRLWTAVQDVMRNYWEIQHCLRTETWTARRLREPKQLKLFSTTEQTRYMRTFRGTDCGWWWRDHQLPNKPGLFIGISGCLLCELLDLTAQRVSLDCDLWMDRLLGQDACGRTCAMQAHTSMIWFRDCAAYLKKMHESVLFFEQRPNNEDE
jgi:hypothetical protein